MRRRRTIPAALCVLAVVLCLTPCLRAQAAAPAPDRAEVLSKFDGAVKALREGKHEAAAGALDEILKMAPTSHEALVLREKAGTALLGRMLAGNAEIHRAFALMVLRRAEEESAGVSRDPATIARYIGLLPSEDVVTREDAIFRLSAIGSAAVPALLDVLLSGDPLAIGVRKASALRALRMMGPTAIPPILAAVRDADADTSSNLIPFLTEIRDARSVPVLCGLLDAPDRPETLKRVAAAVLDELIPPPPPAPVAPGQTAPPPPKRLSGATASYLLAQRYYYNDPVLTEILPPWERVLWTWNAAGATLTERLTAKQVASSYARTMCENLVLQGMRLPHDQPDLIELYVSNSFMQYVEALAVGKAEAARFEAGRRTNESFGARYLYLSLGRALRDRNPELARQCIESLRNIGDSRPPTGENTLAAALEFPDKFVRAAAAEALLRLYPGGDTPAAGRVIAAASGALGALARPRALLLSPDEKLAADLRGVAGRLNVVLETRAEQVDALHRIREMTPPVNVLLIDTRLKGLSASGVVDNLRREAGTAKLPIFLFAPKEDVAKVAAENKGKVPAVCAIPVDANEVGQFLTAAAAVGGTPAAADITENLEILGRILGALKDLPPGTRYPVRELTPALVRLTTGFPVEVRRLALLTLAAQPDPDARDAAYAIFIDAKDPVEIRREAGATLLRALSLRPTVAEDQIVAFRRIAGESDAALASLANRMLAVASIPQAQREADLLKAVFPEAPKAAPAKKPAAAAPGAAAKSDAAPAATKPAAATTTTAKASSAAPKPAASRTPPTTARPAGR